MSCAKCLPTGHASSTLRRRDCTGSQGRKRPNTVTGSFALVSLHFKKFTTEYLQEWDGLGPSLEKMRDEAATPQEAFERYLAAIAGESAYASELEARAISRIFNCCLCVIPQDGRFAPMLFRESQRSRSIILWYASNHIDLLLPTGNAAYHDDLFSPSPGQAWKYKAGGKEGSVRSGTVWSGKTAKSLAHSRLSGTVWTPRPSAKAKSSAKSRTAKAASVVPRQGRFVRFGPTKSALRLVSGQSAAAAFPLCLCVKVISLLLQLLLCSRMWPLIALSGRTTKHSPTCMLFLLPPPQTCRPCPGVMGLLKPLRLEVGLVSSSGVLRDLPGADSALGPGSCQGQGGPA